jgi:PAS domain S-box-containing protein
VGELEARVEELERELAAARADARRYRGLLDHAADGLVVHDDDGRFLEVNERAADLLGYSRAELLTMSLGEVEPDFDRYGIRERWRRIVPGEPLTVEGRPRRKDGVPFVIEARVGLLDDVGGERRYISFIRDISDRNETLRALRESTDRTRRLLEDAQAQLLRVERLATLGTLAAGVGHELNNLAQVLTGEMAMLRDSVRRGVPPDPDGVAALERVVDHVCGHARQLLSFGRPGPAHAEQLDLREVVRSTVEMLRHTGKLRRASVTLDLPPRAVHVTVNRTRIEQVLINLLVNAGDALGDAEVPSGAIRVAVEVQPGGRARCRVSDNGPGIPAERIERIFEAYFTTKPPGQGTGLGLSVVRRIVRDYGGDVEVMSSAGAGATFCFDLPIAS